jgi:hypothetical protein
MVMMSLPARPSAQSHHVAIFSRLPTAVAPCTLAYSGWFTVTEDYTLVTMEIVPINYVVKYSETSLRTLRLQTYTQTYIATVNI